MSCSGDAERLGSSLHVLSRKYWNDEATG